MKESKNKNIYIYSNNQNNKERECVKASKFYSKFI